MIFKFKIGKKLLNFEKIKETKCDELIKNSNIELKRNAIYEKLFGI